LTTPAARCLRVHLREWALSQGIHPQTAYRWYRQDKLPVPARKMGKLILVGDLEAPAREVRGRNGGLRAGVVRRPES